MRGDRKPEDSKKPVKDEKKARKTDKAKKDVVRVKKERAPSSESSLSSDHSASPEADETSNKQKFQDLQDSGMAFGLKLVCRTSM